MIIEFMLSLAVAATIASIAGLKGLGSATSGKQQLTQDRIYKNLSS